MWDMISEVLSEGYIKFYTNITLGTETVSLLTKVIYFNTQILSGYFSLGIYVHVAFTLHLTMSLLCHFTRQSLIDIQYDLYQKSLKDKEKCQATATR